MCGVAQLLTNSPDADSAALAQPLMHRDFVDAVARGAGLLGALPNDFGKSRNLGDRVPVVEALAKSFAGCPAVQRLEKPGDHLTDTVLVDEVLRRASRHLQSAPYVVENEYAVRVKERGCSIRV